MLFIRASRLAYAEVQVGSLTTRSLTCFLPRSYSISNTTNFRRLALKSHNQFFCHQNSHNQNYKLILSTFQKRFFAKRAYARPGRPGPGRSLGPNKKHQRNNASTMLAMSLLAATCGWAGWMYSQRTGPFQLAMTSEEKAEREAQAAAKLSWQLLKDPKNATITHHVYFDIDVNNTRQGRVVMGLFGNVAPKTVENFIVLADQGIPVTATTVSAEDKEENVTEESLKFKGSIFHRVIPEFMIQGGDITKGDGTGGLSIYGPTFPDENFDLWHIRGGCLSMANRGPNSNSSQFFITTRATPWLDGKHVIFGIVTDNFRLIHKLERMGSRSGKPARRIEIVGCGVMTDEEYSIWTEQERKRREQLELEMEDDDDE